MTPWWNDRTPYDDEDEDEEALENPVEDEDTLAFDEDEE